MNSCQASTVFAVAFKKTFSSKILNATKLSRNNALLILTSSKNKVRFLNYDKVRLGFGALIRDSYGRHRYLILRYLCTFSQSVLSKKVLVADTSHACSLLHCPSVLIIVLDSSCGHIWVVLRR